MSVLTIQLDATTQDAAEVIRAAGLSKSIDERLVLDDINLSVKTGSSLALLGANGAGKSTLLKVLATLTPPTVGALSLFGVDVATGTASLRANIGLIGHQSMLYRDLSARQNLEFFGRLYGIRNPRERANELLVAIGMADRADDPVKSFSRGMTQRVAITRALVHDPKLVLADEPFDGLDAPSVAMLEQMLIDLHEAGKTLVLANHDIAQSLRLTQETVVLRQGRIVIDESSADLHPAAVLAEMEQP